MFKNEYSNIQTGNAIIPNLYTTLWTSRSTSRAFCDFNQSSAINVNEVKNLQLQNARLQILLQMSVFSYRHILKGETALTHSAILCKQSWILLASVGSQCVLSVAVSDRPPRRWTQSAERSFGEIDSDSRSRKSKFSAKLSIDHHAIDLDSDLSIIFIRQVKGDYQFLQDYNS